MTAVPLTTTDPLQRAVAFANVFTQAALDAAHAGISPQLISVDKFSEPAPLTVDIQLGDRDTQAVDTLAELYGIEPDPGGCHNYVAAVGAEHCARHLADADDTPDYAQEAGA
jgi:hypothetical protein